MLRILISILLLGLCGSSMAAEESWHKDIDFGIGQRVDKLDWNIAGNLTANNYVNVLSELSWTNIRSVEPYVEFHLISPDHWLFTSYFAAGNIYSGNNQDSDYASNDRRNEFSRSNNNSDSGYTLDFAFSVGRHMPFHIEKHPFAISPQIGYSRHMQHLTITNGNQTLSVPPYQHTPLGPFRGLNSSYQATWTSMWLGFDIDTPLFDKLALTSAVQFHLANFTGKANWNLRSDFAHPVSFEHDGTGKGWIMKLGLSYQIVSQWAITLTDIYQSWKIRNGTDTTFFADNTAASTPLNGVNWQSNTILLGARYSF